MRKVTVEKSAKLILIYIGAVNSDGKYELLKLTEAEAAILMIKLENQLFGKP